MCCLTGTGKQNNINRLEFLDLDVSTVINSGEETRDNRWNP